jgi:hypothetical protein
MTKWSKGGPMTENIPNHSTLNTQCMMEKNVIYLYQSFDQLYKIYTCLIMGMNPSHFQQMMIFRELGFGG